MHKHEGKSDPMKKENVFCDKNISNRNPKGYICLINMSICIASMLYIISFFLPIAKYDLVTVGGVTIQEILYPWNNLFWSTPVYSTGVLVFIASYKKWNISAFWWWFCFAYVGLLLGSACFAFLPLAFREPSRFFVIHFVLLIMSVFIYLYTWLLRRNDNVLGTIALHFILTVPPFLFLLTFSKEPNEPNNHVGLYITFIALCLMILAILALFISIYLEKRKAKLSLVPVSPVVHTKNSSGIGTEGSAGKP